MMPKERNDEADVALPPQSPSYGWTGGSVAEPEVFRHVG